MKRFMIAAACLIVPTMATAQSLSPLEQVLSRKLGQEIDGGLQCSAQLLTVQQTLAAAQEKIREFEAKAAAKPEDADKPK